MTLQEVILSGKPFKEFEGATHIYEYDSDYDQVRFQDTKYPLTMNVCDILSTTWVLAEEKDKEEGTIKFMREEVEILIQQLEEATQQLRDKLVKGAF